MDSLADYRYEIKFGTTPAAVPELRAWIRSHRAGFRTAHPDRLVNSLYFDTADWRALSENLAGVAERAKLRARWYGTNLAVIDGRMELKSKRNQLGRKFVHPIDPPLDLRCGEWRSIVRDLAGRDLGPLSLRLIDDCCPTLLVQYRRAYYVSADGRIRLTVDDDLRTYDQTRSIRPNLGRANVGATPALIEVKGASALGNAVEEVAREMPLRRIAYSKYCTGVLDGLGPSG